jgi:hypothetical protein
MFGRVVLIVLVATFLGWSLLTRSVDGAGRAQVYVVQPGDTLWSIVSARYAGDPREASGSFRTGTTLRGRRSAPASA